MQIHTWTVQVNSEEEHMTSVSMSMNVSEGQYWPVSSVALPSQTVVIIELILIGEKK